MTATKQESLPSPARRDREFPLCAAARRMPALRLGPLVGIQRRREVVDLVPVDAQRAVFDVEVELRAGRDGRPEPRGPYVQGGLASASSTCRWGAVDGDGHFQMFRRLKLWIGRLEESLRRGGALGQPALRSSWW